jgi:peptidoglycan lytic transglycosylase G
MDDGGKYRRKWLIAGVICGIAALLILFIVLVAHYFYPSRGEEPVSVVIEEGESATQIASELADARVITSATIFRFLSWVQGRQDDFKAGNYVFNPGMHYGEVFAMLEEGPNNIVRVTLPEGLTVEQTASRMAQVMAFSEEDFMAAAESGDFGVKIIPAENQANLEGVLFPKTYDFQTDTPAYAVIEVLLQQFDTETSGLDWGRAEELGLTPYQVVIAASIIEREVVLPEERPLVAAVIFNRLRANMLLQMCATVQYCLPEWKEVLTLEDLETPSPYNTYLHKGLPPAPICSPGLASIQAVLNPAQVDYLYYVATGDGGHFFTSDYNEFLRVKEEVQN